MDHRVDDRVDDRVDHLVDHLVDHRVVNPVVLHRNSKLLVRNWAICINEHSAEKTHECCRTFQMVRILQKDHKKPQRST